LWVDKRVWRQLGTAGFGSRRLAKEIFDVIEEVGRCWASASLG
jgi:hypothetical protein